MSRKIPQRFKDDGVRQASQGDGFRSGAHVITVVKRLKYKKLLSMGPKNKNSQHLDRTADAQIFVDSATNLCHVRCLGFFSRLGCHTVVWQGAAVCQHLDHQRSCGVVPSNGTLGVGDLIRFVLQKSTCWCATRRLEFVG